jgi:hypothetical protein
MEFRSKIQEWYTKLERSAPLSPHSIRGAEVEPVSIPILSPVSSPQNQSEQQPAALESSFSINPINPQLMATSTSQRQGEGKQTMEAAMAVLKTPEADERRRTSLCDSDGFPPTPKISATPSTCDVLGLKKKKMTTTASDDENVICRTPEFPVLTPAGLRASEKKFGLDSLSISSDSNFNSPRTPNLDSTPTTTIQLSPSHFVLDDALEDAVGGTIATADAAAGRNNSNDASSPLSSSQNRQNICKAEDVEEKLMSSLYIGSFSTQKSSKKTQQGGKANESTNSGSSNRSAATDFDIGAFPAVFRKGNGSVELEGVYRKVQKLQTLRDQDVGKVFPHFEKERANLLLEVLSSRNYIECVKNSQTGGMCWKVAA